ncbi:MAG: glucose-1-phosphate cytidylyltransferase [Paracoccaceae bacterium]
MQVVLLAGGLGTRLSEETAVRPKPMVEIGGRPILWHIMKIYSHHGINDFIVCLGYKGYVIKEYFANYALHMSDVTFDMRTGETRVHRNDAEGWRVTLVNTGEDTMTGGRIKRVLDRVEGDDFCLTYGDGLSDVNIGAAIRFHKAHGHLATVTGVRPPRRFGHMYMDGDRVRAFHEKPESGGGYINGGFFVLSRKIGAYIDGDDTVWERGPLERIAEDGELHAFRHDGFWHPMDTLRDRIELDEMWSGGRPPWKVWG